MAILTQDVKERKRFSFTAPRPCKMFLSVQDKEYFLLGFDPEVAHRVKLFKKRIPTQYLGNVYDSMINFLGGIGQTFTLDILYALDQDVLYTEYPKTIKWCKDPYCHDLTLESDGNQIKSSFEQEKIRQREIFIHLPYLRDNHAHNHAIRHAQTLETVFHELGVSIPRCKRRIEYVKGVARRLDKRFLDNASQKRNLTRPHYYKSVNYYESNRKSRESRYKKNIRACQQRAIQCLGNDGVVLFISVNLPKTLHAKKRLIPCLPYHPQDFNVFAKADLLRDIQSSTLKRTVKSRRPYELGIGGLWRLEPHEDGTPHMHMLACFPDASVADRYVQNLNKSYAQKTEPFRYVFQMMPDGSDEMLLDIENDAIHVRQLESVDDIKRHAIYILKHTDIQFPDLLQENRRHRYNTFGTFRKASATKGSTPKKVKAVQEVPSVQYQQQDHGTKNARGATIFDQDLHAPVYTNNPALRPSNHVYELPAPSTAWADVGSPWALPSDDESLSSKTRADRNGNFIAILHRMASQRLPIILLKDDFLPNIDYDRYLRPQPRAPPDFLRYF